MSYVTDGHEYFDADERYRAASLLDVLLAEAHGAEVRHRRASAYLAGGLAAVRRQPRLEFRSVEPQPERQGKAMLGPAGVVEYR
jgi:hypothetical protein